MNLFGGLWTGIGNEIYLLSVPCTQKREACKLMKNNGDCCGDTICDQ